MPNYFVLKRYVYSQQERRGSFHVGIYGGFWIFDSQYQGRERAGRKFLSIIGKFFSVPWPGMVNSDVVSKNANSEE